MMQADPRLEAKKKLIAELIALVAGDEGQALKSKYAPKPPAPAAEEAEVVDPNAPGDSDLEMLLNGYPFPDQQGSESPPEDMILEEEMKRKK